MTLPVGVKPLEQRLDEIFPFHFVLDRALRVCTCGPTVARVLGLQPGESFPETFRVLRPRLEVDWESLRAARREFFLFQHREKSLFLRGEFTDYLGPERLLFLGAPWLADAHDLQRFELRITDFPLHDPTVDMLHAFQSSKVAVEDANLALTKLRRRTEELRRSHAEVSTLAALVDAMADGALVMESSSERLSYANEAAATLFGCSRGELLARDPWELFAELPQGGLAEALATVAPHGGASTVIRARTLPTSGEAVPVSVLLQRLEVGAQRRWLLLVRDISAQLVVEGRERRAQRLESIGTLAGGLAHDLNNVLAPVLMSVGMLREELHERPGGSSELVEEVLDAIERSTHRAADMVRHLLSYARGAEGERRLTQPVEIAEEVTRIARMTFPKGVDIRCRLVGAVGRFHADPTQVHQVLLNLLVNARDAMPAGGRLDVEVEQRLIDEDFVNAATGAVWGRCAPGRYVIFRVRDSGQGMSQKVLDRIFDPFYSTKRQDQGTGLGLSTALGIVNGHGGFVKVYTELGRGSEFEVYLPQGHTSSPPPGQARPGPAGFEPALVGGGRRVIYLDDESALCRIATLILRRLGFEPIACTQGDEALARVVEAGSAVCAIVTDLSMPGMDGLSFIRAVRHARPQVPILAASGRFDDEVVQQLYELGVVSLLKKPFTERELSTRLGEALGR